MNIRRLLEAIPGARLCYGEPVQVGGAKVIPVARVRGGGGGGFGRDKSDQGGGGGGFFDAQPVGFIHVTGAGARYEPIPDPEQVNRRIKSAATALATLAAAAAGVRRLRGGSARGLLGR